MKRLTVILAIAALVGLTVSASAEVISETADFSVPENCGAPSVQSTDDCTQCHTLDFGEPDISFMNQQEPAAAGSIATRIIRSTDDKITVRIPDGTVAPGQNFAHSVSISGYVMRYQYAFFNEETGTTEVYDSWPWGVENPPYIHPHVYNTPGEYNFDIYIVYCGDGRPVCFTNWVKTRLEWTVVVDESGACTISVVPCLCQADPQWANTLYDHYTTDDPNKKTIADVGCSIISVTMIARRYGINNVMVEENERFVDPATMNAWLAVQEDGFTSDRDPDWRTFREFSFQDIDNPDLRLWFSKLTDTWTTGDEPTSYPECFYNQEILDNKCSRINQSIDEEVCAGRPVMIKVKSRTTSGYHYIVADGQKTVPAIPPFPTLSILDPGCTTCDQNADKTLFDQYSNYYHGIRTFKLKGDVQDPSQFVVYLGSPAVFNVADSAGNRTGLNPETGTIIEEIPNSSIVDDSVESSEPFWVVELYNPGEGEYRVTVTGTGEGPFTANFLAVDDEFGVKSSRLEGEIFDGREYTYQVGYSPYPSGIVSVVPTTYNFSGFAEPLRSDVIPVFKLNRTIPVKFSISRNDGSPHSDIKARLSLELVDSSLPVGEPVEPDGAGEANADGYFRYDPQADHYIYNLSTKTLASGTWQLTVLLDDGSAEHISFGLK
ncbi:MAG: PxKF domain-containing protein [bacterium]|nr:PxKF domain-containing protein [bacterium]MDT8367142.1 PxKF domain-containing protein [bacterium]